MQEQVSIYILLRRNQYSEK